MMEQKATRKRTKYFVKLRKQGNSLVLTVPKGLIATLGWEEGEILYLQAGRKAGRLQIDDSEAAKPAPTILAFRSDFTTTTIRDLIKSLEDALKAEEKSERKDKKESSDE